MQVTLLRISGYPLLRISGYAIHFPVGALLSDVYSEALSKEPYKRDKRDDVLLRISGYASHLPAGAPP